MMKHSEIFEIAGLKPATFFAAVFAAIFGLTGAVVVYLLGVDEAEARRASYKPVLIAVLGMIISVTLTIILVKVFNMEPWGAAAIATFFGVRGKKDLDRIVETFWIIADGIVKRLTGL